MHYFPGAINEAFASQNMEEPIINAESGRIICQEIVQMIKEDIYSDRERSQIVIIGLRKTCIASLIYFSL